jgi:hypothetical protein
VLLGKEDKVVGHPPELVREIAEAHLKAYGPGDIDHLMRSVSPRGGIWAGIAPPDGAVLLRTADEVRDLYGKLLDAMEVGESDKIISVCTDWYVFNEGLSTTTDKAAGRLFETPFICLFGNDELGTAIDMAWPFGMNLGPPADAAATAVERPPLSDLKAHKTRMAGWSLGDAKQAAEGVADRCLLFLPSFDPEDERLAVLVRGRSDYEAYLADLFRTQRITDLKPSNTIVRDRYVFSEHAMTMTRDGEATRVRYALAEVFDDAGRIQGMLGFATRR